MSDALTEKATNYKEAYKYWNSVSPDTARVPAPAGFLPEGQIWDSSSDLMDRYLEAGAADDAAGGGTANLDEFWNGLSNTEKQKLQYAWGQAALYNFANYGPEKGTATETLGLGLPSFKTAFQSVFDKLDNNTRQDTDKIHEMFHTSLEEMAAQLEGADYSGQNIQTQEDAQKALVAINEAIVSKDKIRAHLGALQNRLENTVSNLNIQAESLQAAESRISDVDVATEMTQFVRNQILTQSAVAMLSQANSLPQMAMQLIG